MRTVLHVLLFLVLATLFGGGAMFFVVKVVGYQPKAIWEPVDFILSEGLQLLGVLGALLVLARIEKRRAGEYGLPLVRGAALRLALGAAVGLALVTLLVGAIALLGGVTFSGLAAPGARVLASAAKWAAAMLLLGLFEEALFRGYPLAALTERFGFWPAALATSLFFGGLHFFTKPHETLLDATSVTLIGVLLCLSVRRTGDLWWAAGFHAAFDFAALVVFAAPNSGNDGKPVAGHVLDAAYRGPAWLTGGACGIEASALILPLLVALGLALARHIRIPSTSNGRGARARP